MNGFELGVDERCLDERSEAVIVDRVAEISEQAINVLRRWRHEVGAAGVVVVAADPVLLRPNAAGDPVVFRSFNQAPVDGGNFASPKGLNSRSLIDGQTHRVNIGQDFDSRAARVRTGIELGFRACQFANAKVHAFNPGRRDGLRAQEEPRGGHERNPRALVEVPDGMLRL